MKKILGLDLGTNSIGWALVARDESEFNGKIVDVGVRVIPMDGYVSTKTGVASKDPYSDFIHGNGISKAHARTKFRSTRRIRERFLLRRERLHRVLNILGFLPEHYSHAIDFDKRLGQFNKETEAKLAYDANGNFIFKKSFEEMVNDFRKSQPQLLINKDGKPALIPYDWTLYYLRKKALSQRIEKEELAWLLLHFNQKRGYFQLRGEDDEKNDDKLVEFYELKVVKVEDSGEKKKDDVWYNVILENGWIYRRSSRVPLFDWEGKIKEFIVTTDINPDGSVKIHKDGKEKRSFKAVNSEEDWIAIKKSTENKIEGSGKTVGSYIYDALLQNPDQKIRGKLIRTIERKFYKSELEAILDRQISEHPELKSSDLYKECLNELYCYNEAHKSSISNQGLKELFVNDIIFYQRPLKSKKSLISNCRYEERKYIDKNGQSGTTPIKCIAKSHPLFQEFRLWQWMRNLKIYRVENDNDVTVDFLKTEDDWVGLFDWLNTKKEIDQKAFLKYPGFGLKKDSEKYRWNFVEDKSYPCNETHAQILSRLSKVPGISQDFLSRDVEEALWHILYSVDGRAEIEKALTTFAGNNNLSEEFVDHFKKFPRIEKEYGAYSAKAIKKLLPLMRLGKYWNSENIHKETKDRIDKILTGEYDSKIKDKVREKAINLKTISDFKGLPLWLSCYVVYDRFAEEGEIKKWKTADEIELLDQHSLRNPIVEQVINETLQVVRDIWKTHGEGKENFFDEIHVELGREMKNPADKRKSITKQISENENTNLRIKALLMEMSADNAIHNVRPYSPSQQEILKIYENGVLGATGEIPEDILKISKASQPSKSELQRYKMWLEQKYRSPYTGEIIPLNRLFSSDYEIEHIIPQSRYFDDSFANKVICESEVNKLKGNALGFEFIKNHHGEIITLNYGKTARVFSEEEYQEFVKVNFGKPESRGKKNRLLMEDIPEKMIQRQLNDTRYISKVVKNLLSNIVREEGETDTTSKHVLASNGTITTVLKQDWGMNDVWNDIIAPRFKRLNELTKSNSFGEINPNTQKFLPKVPVELQKGFNKKRIDHRHHAMDAIVIACAGRNHINYLNNEYAKADKKDTRYELRNKLCLKKYDSSQSDNYKWVFKKPWESFSVEAKEKLLTTVISFKQNLRVINKTVNQYQRWEVSTDGERKRVTVLQKQGTNWAIRKPLHKDTVSGLVKLRFKKEVSLSTALDDPQQIVDKTLKKKIYELSNIGQDKKSILKYFKDKENLWNDKNISKIEVYFWENEQVASRVSLDDSFNSDKITSITDSGIQSILIRHLEQYSENKDGKLIEHPELAFSPEGIEKLNEGIKSLNNGVDHKPIFKVRTFEPKGNKYNVGSTGNKKDKFVEAAKGTNLYFAIYKNTEGKRSYATIPLFLVAERLIQGLSLVPEKNENGEQLLFHLSPNDLVYVPCSEDTENIHSFDFKRITSEQAQRIYKFVSCSENEGHLVPIFYSNAIMKNEIGSNNKSQNTIDGTQIKAYCWKLVVNRLGMVTGIVR